MITLDQIKGILQVMVPTLTAWLVGKGFIPADQVTAFDNAIILVVVTAISAVWSAQTTKTGGVK